MLRRKSKLKETSDYKRVFLRGSKTHTQRVLELNARTLLDQMPNGNEFRITSSGRIVKKNKCDDGDRGRSRDQQNNQPRGSRERVMEKNDEQGMQGDSHSGGTVNRLPGASTWRFGQQGSTETVRPLPCEVATAASVVGGALQLRENDDSQQPSTSGNMDSNSGNTMLSSSSQ